MVVPDAPRIRGLEHLWERSSSERVTCRAGKFGASRDGGRRRHGGIDLEARFEPVGAAMAGRVKFADAAGGGSGKLVIIDHGYGVETRYAHLDAISVRVGEYVERADRIGTSGRTGTRAPHLHFEVRRAGTSVEPGSVLTPAGAPLAGRRPAGPSRLLAATSSARPPLPAATTHAVPIPAPVTPTPEVPRAAAPVRDRVAPSAHPLAQFFDWIASWADRIGWTSVAALVRAVSSSFSGTVAADAPRAPARAAPSPREPAPTQAVSHRLAESPSRDRATGRTAVVADIGRSIFEETS